MPKLSPEALAQIARTGAPPPLQETPKAAGNAPSNPSPSGTAESRPEPGSLAASQAERREPAPAVKARRTKGKGRETPRISLDLPADLHMRFARALLEERLEVGRAIPMTEVLRELVGFWLRDESLRQRVREALEEEE